MKKKIVIVGAGFGGLYTFLALRKHLQKHNLEVLLINKTSYFLFTPLLVEATFSEISQLHVVRAARDIIKEYPADFLLAEVTNVDFETKSLQTIQGVIPYDMLVLATGAATNHYGILGAKEYSFELKTLADAARIRDHILDVLETASREKDPKKRASLLRFVVVGGGATGVEFVSELSELVSITVEKMYNRVFSPKDIHICLINSGPEVLPRLHEYLRKSATGRLTKLHVDIRFNSRVVAVKEDGLELKSGDFIETHTMVWVAGVIPTIPKLSRNVLTEKSGRIMVNTYLQIDNDPSAYALGDAASVMDKDNHELPMLAQVAVKEGAVVAHNIIATLEKKEMKKFHYVSLGTLVSLGHGQALADIYGIRMSGIHIWLLWRLVYLYKFPSWTKKVKILNDWIINCFLARDISRNV